MAKYSRHDNRNKKRNKHKNLVQYGSPKKIKYVESDKRMYDEQHNISVSSRQRGS